MAFLAPHIQIGRGTVEFHFGAFVLLGLLLNYRDWRPIVLGAALFAVHHVALDRMQAFGLGVYCTPEANFLKMAMHALYGVVQASVEILLALRVRQSAVESSQLAAIVRSVDRGETLCLDLSGLVVRAPTAVALKSAIGKMALAMAHVSAAAGSIEVASAEVAAGNLDLHQRTEAQASNLQRTAGWAREGTSAATTAKPRPCSPARAASTAALEAVTHLDSVTQQNAALVEESAAAAESLRQQAKGLNAVVQRFSTAAAGR